MRTLKLTIAFDGTGYVGWQVQSNGLSVQEALENVWTSITHEKIRITASGRTDSGVHALAQVCSLITKSDFTCNQILRALNGNLPLDIRILDVEEAPDGFHAIRDAVSKTYRYQIQTGFIHNVFELQNRWFVPKGLDVSAMAEGATHLVGTHDFSSFEAKGAPRQDSIRTISDLSVIGSQTDRYENVDVEVTADGFLYNMVRNIVGSLVFVGRGRKPPDWIHQILEARDRSQAGETAPAHGLFMVKVRYD